MHNWVKCCRMLFHWAGTMGQRSIRIIDLSWLHNGPNFNLTNPHFISLNTIPFNPPLVFPNYPTLPYLFSHTSTLISTPSHFGSISSNLHFFNKSLSWLQRLEKEGKFFKHGVWEVALDLVIQIRKGLIWNNKLRVRSIEASSTLRILIPE